MLPELYDFGFETRTLHLVAGLVLGLVFGVSAQISRFCFRRVVAGPLEGRAPAASAWLVALVSAIAGFAVLSGFRLVDAGGHHLLSPEIPVLAIVSGGCAFGAGMVMARGCVSRLTVLSATGNLRAVFVLLVLAVAAHGTIKGVLAPARVAIGSVTLDMPFTSLGESAFATWFLVALLTAGAVAVIRRAHTPVLHLVLGAVIGLVCVAGWALTSVLLFDEFEPLPTRSAAFIAPWSDTLFWIIASSAIPAGFGEGFIGGVLGGSFLSAAFRGEWKLQSFDGPAQTLRYGAGGILMGVGGVLAGGCTIGAGLSGLATGSVAAILALAGIALGGWVTPDAPRQKSGVPATA
ncbi:MAG: YeeE/YedE family protein [Rhodobacteraceae bacterium]|nr:YeeE/YedE family protein [Paracoccaceae bacterium]